MSTHTTDPGSRDSIPTVTVRGEAVVRAEPYEAMLWVTLSALENDPGPALADVSRRSDALVAMLDELGVTKKDRSTTGITIYEEFDHTRQWTAIARPPSRRERLSAPDRSGTDRSAHNESHDGATGQDRRSPMADRGPEPGPPPSGPRGRR